MRDLFEPSNVGAIVNVLEWVPASGIESPEGFLWEGNGWLVRSERMLEAEGDLVRYLVFDDFSLHPIRPAPELVPAPPQEVTA